MTGNPGQVAYCDLSCQSLPRTFFITWKHRGRWAKHVPDTSMLDCLHSVSWDAPWTPDIMYEDLTWGSDEESKLTKYLQADVVCEDWRPTITPTHPPRLVVVCLTWVHLEGEFNLCFPKEQERTLHRRNRAWLPPCSVSMYLGTGNLVRSTCS